jgi:hypothetical protein
MIADEIEAPSAELAELHAVFDAAVQRRLAE